MFGLLTTAVANAGGPGACGALLMQPAAILEWAAERRSLSSGPFQLNLWVPNPPPQRGPAGEALARIFLEQWGTTVAPGSGNAAMPDFAAQCEAPPIVSSIMGLYPPELARRLKRCGISWWVVATVAEIRMAVDGKRWLSEMSRNALT